MCLGATVTEGCELPGIELAVGRVHRSSHSPSAIFRTGDLSSSIIATLLALAQTTETTCTFRTLKLRQCDQPVGLRECHRDS